MYWRNTGKDYCAQDEIKSWGGASEAQNQALVGAVRVFTGFRPAMRAQLVLGSEFHKTALVSLLQDCMKKRSKSAKNLAQKRALKSPHLNKDNYDAQ